MNDCFPEHSKEEVGITELSTLSHWYLLFTYPDFSRTMPSQKHVLNGAKRRCTMGQGFKIHAKPHNEYLLL